MRFHRKQPGANGSRIRTNAAEQQCNAPMCDFAREQLNDACHHGGRRGAISPGVGKRVKTVKTRGSKCKDTWQACKDSKDNGF